jgi:quercetin dioxygenase-like cupin family protein
MPVIRHADSRRTETPNAVMTTLASPGQGGAGYAIWRVDMRPGQAGPPHAVDTEQVWTVLNGGAAVTLGPETVTLTPGDTVIIPAGQPRRVSADPAAGFAAIVVAPPGTRAWVHDGIRSAVPDSEKIAPAWTL